MLTSGCYNLILEGIASTWIVFYVVDFMPKFQPLCTSAEWNLGDRVLDEVKRVFYCFARQRGTQWATALKNCVSTWEDLMSYIATVQVMRLLIGFACVQGLHSSNLVTGNLLGELLWFLASGGSWLLSP